MARQVLSLDAGQAVTVTIGDGIRLTIIPGVGSTVTYSRVDDSNASGHSDDTTDVLAADGVTPVTPDWPFYHVSTAGGSARLGVV